MLFEPIEGEKEIIPGVWATGPIPRRMGFENSGGDFFVDEEGRKPDGFRDDLALFMETPVGVVVLLGCAHAGVVNTLNRVARLLRRKKIFAVLGGMHLINCTAERLVFTTEAFRKHGIERVGIAHCTGFNAARHFHNEFGEGCFFCHTGTTLTFA